MKNTKGKLTRNAVRAGMVPVIQNHITLGNVLLLQPNLARRALRDPQHLVKRLLDLGTRIHPDNLPRPRALRLLRQLEPGNHARKRRPRHRAHNHRVKEHAQLLLLRLDLERPPCEPQPAERVVRRARGDVVRLLARGLELRGELGQGRLVLDAKGRRVQARVAAHQARELQVADFLVAGVRPVDPVLLDGGGFEARGDGDGGHGAGVVGLDAADGHPTCPKMCQLLCVLS